MGRVYEVHDRERGQRMALKAMRGRDPAALYLFKQEFRSLALLSHPNLLPLYELFEDRGTWCFTMELLEGALDFRRWVWNQPSGGVAREPTAVTEGRPGPVAVGAEPVATLPSPEPLARGATPADEGRLRAALAQLVEGVTALHAAGMLHRDLKPENVLVTPDGRVRLLDFGLVAELHVDTRTAPDAPAGSRAGSPGRLRRVHESADSHLAGTIHYMSPEQATALPLSPASDWYAVGVMLYEALTGQKPFGGTRRTLRELVDAMGGRAPAAPSSVASGVPADLSDLCLALLDRDPERRPGAAAAARSGLGHDGGCASHGRGSLGDGAALRGPRAASRDARSRVRARPIRRGCHLPRARPLRGGEERARRPLPAAARRAHLGRNAFGPVLRAGVGSLQGLGQPGRLALPASRAPARGRARGVAAGGCRGPRARLSGAAAP